MARYPAVVVLSNLAPLVEFANQRRELAPDCVAHERLLFASRVVFLLHRDVNATAGSHQPRVPR